jgi:hypothetical protein
MINLGAPTQVAAENEENKSQNDDHDHEDHDHHGIPKRDPVPKPQRSHKRK